MMKNQMRVDAAVRFDIEAYSEGNEGKTIFSCDRNIK